MSLSFPFKSQRMRDLVHLNPGFYQKNKTALTNLGLEVFRNPDLQVYDSYLENVQYKSLPEPTDETEPENSRSHQPSLIFPLPAIATDVLSSHICEDNSQLHFRVEDTDQQEIINDFIKEIMLWEVIEFALPSYFVNGSMFIRYYKTPKGKLILEPFNTKYCWPEWDDEGELESVLIRYVYNSGEIDSKKEPIYNWFQYKLGKKEDIIYDNPVFTKSQTTLPAFKETTIVEHKMGFVCGEWVKTTFSPESDDGESLLKNCLEYLDNFNYMDSKEGNSIYYHLFPMLAAYNVSFDEFRDFIMQSKHVDPLKKKNLLSIPKPPNQAALQFVESSMTAAAYAGAYLERNFKFLQQMLGIVILDPDRVAAHAQSGRALSILFKPMVQFIKKKRKPLKRGICSLLNKLVLSNEKLNAMYDIDSDIFESAKKEWGEIFEDTAEDIAAKVNYTLQAKDGGLISPLTAVKQTASNFNILNPTEELTEIDKAKEADIKRETLAFGQPPGGEPGPAPKPKPEPKK